MRYKNFQIKKGWFIAILLVVLSGCSPFFHQPMSTERARLGPETPLNKGFLTLPQPQEKIVAAVYKFRDQTGQYKPSETGANWSTAVTQGATTILIRALEESNWFIPIERENIGNLLNERKIIRSSRAQYAGKKEDESELLPPLLFAGILLEGGIISYESNIITGGAGLRYFGTGGSGQYREDRVSIYLRAVSTSNGRILKTVYTTKTILSQSISANLFKYVKFKRLLEAEIGVTYNEPSEMAVTEAIEKAVQSLIIEGVYDALWPLKNPSDTTLMVFKDYKIDKLENENIDTFGRDLSQPNRGKFGVGIISGPVITDGDYPDAVASPFGEVQLKWDMNPSWYLTMNSGFGTLRTKDPYFANYFDMDFSVGYRLLPFDKFTPFARMGIGFITEIGKGQRYSTATVFPKLASEVGFEFLPHPKLGISLGAGNSITFGDGFDGIEQGRFWDMYWQARLGIMYYFGNGKKIKTSTSK